MSRSPAVPERRRDRCPGGLCEEPLPEPSPCTYFGHGVGVLGDLCASSPGVCLWGLGPSPHSLSSQLSGRPDGMRARFGYLPRVFLL